MGGRNQTEGYFHRVNESTPTRFWINNPTLAESDAAIEAGAVSCTTNPTYSAKMLKTPTERERALLSVTEVLARSATLRPAEAAPEIQRRIVAPVLERFRPLFEKTRGAGGFVSIQGDPFAEENVEGVVEEAHAGRELSPNFIAKIPATDAGLRAIERLVGEDIPIIATEVMSVDQAVAACETYRRASRSSGRYPAFYVTHITGIFDEYLAGLMAQEGLEISPDVLWVAGLAVARKQLRIMRERAYPGILLGGGARGLHHFTELVGEPAHVTINWNGTAEELVRLDSPVVSRAGCPVPDTFVDELMERIPDFRRAYAVGGLSREEFKDFGPVVLFRKSFEEGWRSLIDEVRSRHSGGSESATANETVGPEAAPGIKG